MITAATATALSHASDQDDDGLTSVSGLLPPIYALGESDDFYATSVKAAATAASTTTTPTQVLYLTEPGTTTAISASDLYQGQIGDCFLISSIGEIALNQPTAISNMIHVNSDGSETVTLYEASNGHLPGCNTTSFKAVQVNVTNTFPTNAIDNQSSQDVVGNQKEIWPQVLEKAFATLNGGYNAISNGGSPVIAMEELTGKAATSVSTNNVTLAQLQGYVTAGDLVVMDTRSTSNLPDNLVSGHAYMFQSVTGTGSAAAVHLLNPWGFNQPTAIPLSQLSKGITEIDIGHV